MKNAFCLCLLFTGVVAHSLWSQHIEIDSVCFSTPHDDYGVRRFGTEHLTVVSAAKPDVNGNRPVDEVLRKPFSDVFKISKCKLEDLNILSKELNLWTNINSSLNDSPISTNKAGTLLFLSNNSSKSSSAKLSIFWTVKEDGFWSTPKSAPINSAVHNTTHPFYDEYTDRLYFASDRVGGKGGYDIYFVPFNNGKFGKVQAVNEVNSEYSEVFPFVQKEILYFTSNNPINSNGAFDIFYLEKDGEIKNMGQPINSNYDDVAIMFETDSTGYFSTNRNSQGSIDDVFSFTIYKNKLVADQFKKTTITEKDVVMSNEELAEEQVPNEDGLTKDVGNIDKNEIIEGDSGGVKNNENKNGLSPTGVKELLVQKEIDGKVVAPVRGSFVLSDEESQVKFAFDKYNIQQSFYRMLDDIVMIANKNDELYILVAGHTDNVGTREYNLLLSEKRALEVKKYFIQKGVKSNRIIIEYHAFDKPIATNETPEGRAKNRRTEISFLGKVGAE